jgi:hypothetical protein
MVNCGINRPSIIITALSSFVGGEQPTPPPHVTVL